MLQLVDILNTLFRSWVINRQLTFIAETFELLVKSYTKFDLLFVNIQCATCMFTWKSELSSLNSYTFWTMSVFYNICSICCVDSRIQILKVWLKSMLPLLKYRIFTRCTLYILSLLCSRRVFTHTVTFEMWYKKVTGVPYQKFFICGCSWMVKNIHAVVV